LSIPTQRWLLPPLAVTVIAVAASLALHVPAYVGLGVLKDILGDGAPPAPSVPMEIEIVERRPSQTDTAAVAPTVPVEDDEVPSEERPEEREPVAVAPPEPQPEPEPEPEPQVVPAPAPPEARPETRRATSVAQRSSDPSVPPPDDAQYLAEENNRVEEETLARVATAHTDDEETSVPAAEEPTPESEEEGDAAEEEVADLQDAEGSDERTPTPEEARVRPPERPREASTSRTPTVSEAAEGEARGGAAESERPPRQAAGGGRQAQGGGARPMREVIVSDGTGTFRMRVPADRPEGEGEGEGGGLAIDGSGQGSEGEGRASGRAGRGRRRARGGGRSGGGAPDLRLSWSDFAAVYGEEELEREREAWLEQRRTRTRGAGHQERWDRFRAALENYDVNVRPGNQTALNARADPFAAYIASMHRRIHRRFAEDFSLHLPSTVQAVLPSNPDMHTKLEIAIGPNGNIARIGVVATSGDILFDFGAYNAVMASQPFEIPPENIRSPDGLVYMHWGFYANHRQCGTFNAEAYILARAPGAPAPPSLPGESMFNPTPNEPSPRRAGAMRDDGQ